jgi:hypothetical protein
MDATRFRPVGQPRVLWPSFMAVLIAWELMLIVLLELVAKAPLIEE